MKITSDRPADNRLRRTYGLSLDEYDAILQTQAGCCAICRRAPTNRRLSVDHCHKSGLLRGLLCHRCNKALSSFSDNAEMLRAAARYIDHPPISELYGHRYTAPGRIKTKKRAKLLRLIK